MDSKNLIGTWNLLSWNHKTEDSQTYFPMGEDAFGRIIYSADGYLAVTLSAKARPFFEAEGLFDGTPTEKTAAIDTYISYTGTYKILSDRIVHQPEASLFPNWIGSEQERFFRFENDQLVLFTAPFETAAGKKEIATLYWEKLPATPQS